MTATHEFKVPPLRELKGLLDRHQRLLGRLTQFLQRHLGDRLQEALRDGPHGDTPVGRSAAIDEVLYGRTMSHPIYPALDRFIEASSLNSSDAALAEGFRDEFRGVFLLGARQGPVLEGFNLVDRTGYLLATSETNPQSATVKALDITGGWCVARVTRLPDTDVYVLTGPLSFLPPEAQEDAITMAHRVAASQPWNNLRNPEFRATALERQAATHAAFRDAFANQTLVHDTVAALEAGLAQVFSTPPGDLLGVFGHLAALADQHQTERLGLHSDPVEGIGLYPRLGDLLDALTLPPDPTPSDAALTFARVLLQDPEKPPSLLDDLAAIDLAGFNRVFGAAFDDPEFAWEAGRDLYLTAHKLGYDRRDPMPRTSVFDRDALADHIASWRQAAQAREGALVSVARRRSRRRRR